MNGEDVALISAQIALNQKAAAAAQEIIEEFRRAGFTTGPLIANSFSITAARSLFESYFHVGLESSPQSGIRVAGSGAYELPVDTLPLTVRGKVKVATFSRPPDFGPGGNF